MYPIRPLSLYTIDIPLERLRDPIQSRQYRAICRLIRWGEPPGTQQCSCRLIYD